MALMAAVVGFPHLMAGFNNRQLTELVASFLDEPSTSRQATYNLRRLKRKGAHRTPTPHQPLPAQPARSSMAVLFTKAHGRVLTPGQALLDSILGYPDEVADHSPLALAGRKPDMTLDEFIYNRLVAA